MKSLRTGLLLLSALSLGACAMNGAHGRQNFALLVAGASRGETNLSDLENVKVYLGTLKDAPAAAGPSRSVEIQELRGGDAGAGNFYAELAARLLYVRKSGGDVFVYWTGSARWQRDDVLLGDDADAIELSTVRSLLQIAPDANVLVVINSGIDGAQSDDEARVVQVCASRPGQCIWIAQPIGTASNLADVESWATCFCSQLESGDADADTAAGWRRMRAALVNARKQIEKPTMSEALGTPTGLWWLWQHGQPPRAAPVVTPPAVTPPPPADAPRTD